MKKSHNMPGFHTGQGYAIHSRPLGKWVNVWTRGLYGPSNGEKCVRWFEVKDHAVQIARTQKTARLLMSTLPACIAKKLRESQDHLDRIRTFNRAVAGHMLDISTHRCVLEYWEKEVQQLQALMGGPMELVEITRETTVTHKVVP